MVDKGAKQNKWAGRHIASIDIGSHTVRLLVAQEVSSPKLFTPIHRKRGYSRLADGFDKDGDRVLLPEAMERALIHLKDCSTILKKYKVEKPIAISTGIVRDAVNQDTFLKSIYNRTGIHAKVISGEEEAVLTKLGVLHALNLSQAPSMIFDLGGSTTEFIPHKGSGTDIRSIPLGAMVLTQRFFDSDPPEMEGIKNLSRHVDIVLENTFPQQSVVFNQVLLIGSGGTMATLGAMINHMDVKEISPDKLNGLRLEREQIEGVFAFLKNMPIEDRIKQKGLDEGRAEVILAGTLIILRILHHFHSSEVMVSHSDLLEGALIDYLQGE